MVQTQQIISETILKMIRTAERPSTLTNEANSAAIKAFEGIRRAGVSLSDIIEEQADCSIGAIQPQSVLLREKIQLITENSGLKAQLEKSIGRVSTQSRTISKAKDKIDEQRKVISAKEVALKSVHAHLAAERAKPAPISADDWAAQEKKARDQQAKITRLEEALAKAAVPPAAAPAPNAPASAPVAPAVVSKRSQGARRASATPPANAAADAHTTAPKAPKENMRTRVVEILKSCQGIPMTAQEIAEHLAANPAYANKPYKWHKCRSGQLRAEVLGRRESLAKSGVTVIAVPLGTRMIYRFVWTGKGQ